MSRHHIADEDEEFIMLVLSFQNSALMVIVPLMTMLGKERDSFI
jgi:hypothetical protein